MTPSKHVAIGTERRRENIMVPYSMIGVIVAIILQSMAAVWWASGVNVKLDYLQKVQGETSAIVADGVKDRYTSIDATKDWTANDKRISFIEQQLREENERINNNDKRISKIEDNPRQK